MLSGPIFAPGSKEIWLGTAGDDLIGGGPNAKEMRGLDGNDTYIVNKSKDTVSEAVGAGTDDHVFASQNFTLPDHVEHLTIQGDRLPAIHVASSEDELVEKENGLLGGVDTVYSTARYTLSKDVENLTLGGSANIDAVGNGSANVLTANDGDHTLDGQAGADPMTGGFGNDTYIVNHGGDVVAESLSEDNDTVYSQIAFYTLEQNVENLILQGATAFNGGCNALDNSIIGNDFVIRRMRVEEGPGP